MKWSEFKKLVDKELNGKDPIIDYIDVTDPNNRSINELLLVYIDPHDDTMSILN